MASRKSFLGKSSYIFPTTSDHTDFNPKSTDAVLEFDEADIWTFSGNTTNPVTESTKKALPTSRSALKRSSRKTDSSSRVTPAVSGPSSLPVNIPDWSKILKEDYKEHRRESDEHEGNDDVEEMEIPPHEYLARTRGASLSVHEGIGRTLKGRDLRSVRNAIWKKVGFED